MDTQTSAETLDRIPNKIISLVGNPEIDAMDILLGIQRTVHIHSLQAEFLGVTTVMERMKSVAIVGSQRLGESFKDALEGVAVFVENIPDGMGVPDDITLLNDPDYFTKWGLKNDR